MDHSTHTPGAHGMSAVVTGIDTAAAVVLVLWTVGMWLAVAALAWGNRRSVRPWMYRTAVAVIALGAIGQIGHFQEHIAQAAYWIANPEAPAWMTPWGDSMARGMGQIDPSKPSLGMEVLHLTGNFNFLAGLVGVMQITHRATRTLRARKWAKMGVWMQGIHGVEHVVLTLSVVLGSSRAVGLSTWFGAIPPGTALTTYRVWWHFVANLAGSAVFAMALFHLWRERCVVAATHAQAALGQDEHVPADHSEAPAEARVSTGSSALSTQPARAHQ